MEPAPLPPLKNTPQTTPLGRRRPTLSSRVLLERLVEKKLQRRLAFSPHSPGGGAVKRPDDVSKNHCRRDQRVQTATEWQRVHAGVRPTSCSKRPGTQFGAGFYRHSNHDNRLCDVERFERGNRIVHLVEDLNELKQDIQPPCHQAIHWASAARRTEFIGSPNQQLGCSHPWPPMSQPKARDSLATRTTTASSSSRNSSHSRPTLVLGDRCDCRPTLRIACFSRGAHEH